MHKDTYWESGFASKVAIKFLVCFLVPAFIFLLAGPRSFADTIDQSFTSGDNLGANINDCCPFIGQTYTAGLTGTLAAVSVDINELPGNNFPLDVQIRTVFDGLPTSSILGETTTKAFSLGDLITFQQKIPQVTGVEYAIVVDFLGAPPYGPGQDVGIWSGASGNLYPRGGLVESPNGVSWMISGPSPNNNDVHFETFVNTVPESGSALLVCSGLLALGMSFQGRLFRRTHNPQASPKPTC